MITGRRPVRGERDPVVDTAETGRRIQEGRRPRRTVAGRPPPPDHACRQKARMQWSSTASVTFPCIRGAHLAVEWLPRPGTKAILLHPCLSETVSLHPWRRAPGRTPSHRPDRSSVHVKPGLLDTRDTHLQARWSTHPDHTPVCRPHRRTLLSSARISSHRCPPDHTSGGPATGTYLSQVLPGRLLSFLMSSWGLIPLLG